MFSKDFQESTFVTDVTSLCKKNVAKTLKDHLEAFLGGLGDALEGLGEALGSGGRGGFGEPLGSRPEGPKENLGRTSWRTRPNPGRFCGPSA